MFEKPKLKLFSEKCCSHLYLHSTMLLMVAILKKSFIVYHLFFFYFVMTRYGYDFLFSLLLYKMSYKTCALLDFAFFIEYYFPGNHLISFHRDCSHSFLQWH